jgi:hypothetical protein
MMWDRSLKGKCGPSDVLARANDLSPTQGQTAVMDDLDRLRESPDLCALLDHYIELGKANHDTWQDRLMEVNGLDAKEITKLHGSLLALNWLQQNTGTVPYLKRGAVPGCYRVTPAGYRAVAAARTSERESEELRSEAA